MSTEVGGIALFGGSFDPVHIGHLFIVEEARRALNIDRVFFVPAFRPPHKDTAPQATPDQRLCMLELAVQDRQGCTVLDWEMHRGGVSYTIDTVERLMSEFPIEAKPQLIIGDDLCAEFEKWKEAERLLSLVEVVVATRGGMTDFGIIREYRLIDNSPLPVSSSDIRTRVSEGRNYRDLVPQTVYSYIEQHGLYRRT